MTQTGLHHKMEFNIWEVEEVPAVQGCHHLHSSCEECICHPIVERRMDCTAGGVHNSGTFSGGYRGDRWRGDCYSCCSFYITCTQNSQITNYGCFALCYLYHTIWIIMYIVLSFFFIFIFLSSSFIILYSCWGCTINHNLIRIRKCVSKCYLIQLLTSVILVYTQFLFGKGP